MLSCYRARHFSGLIVSPLILSHSLAALLLSRDPNAFLDTALDRRVFLFAALLTSAAVLVAGLLPAVLATQGDINQKIRNSSFARSTFGRRRLLPHFLLASEVGLALMLLIGSVLLATSLSRLYRTGLGFDPRGLVNLQLNMDKQPLQGEALLGWYKQFADAIGQQPEVTAVSYESNTPLRGSTWTDGIGSPLSPEQGNST